MGNSPGEEESTKEDHPSEDTSVDRVWTILLASSAAAVALESAAVPGVVVKDAERWRRVWKGRRRL